MKRLIAFIAVVCLAACQKAPELTLTGPASLEISADGGSNSITFTTNRDWTVRSSESWVSISPSSGTTSDGTVTVSIRCDANTTYEDRSATITIKAEDLTQTVSVRQPANLGIIVPTKSYDLPSNANTIEIDVQANTQYSVSVSDSWIKQTDTKGLTKNTLVFSVSENTTYDNRSASITIKSQNSAVADQVITVRQAQKDAIIVKDSSFSLPYGGGGIEVKVESNVSFDVTPSMDWIHYVSTKALSNSTVSLIVDENTTYDEREGTVIFKSQNNSVADQVINVKQAAHEGILAVDLGLSVKWASVNMGAAKPWEYGDYFAWGETEPKTVYAWSTYKWANGSYVKLTKYCSTDETSYWDGAGGPDGKTVLDPEDDVAHVKLGGKWRMPTLVELDALRSQCTWIRTTKNGVKGYEVKSKVNSNSIFLPAAGFRNVTSLERAGLDGVYWSSSLYTSYPYYACLYSFDSYFVEWGFSERNVGYTVRPVTE